MNSNPFRQAGTGTFLAMVLLASSAGCHSVDRSRALDDGRVPAITIAAQVCSNCHGIRGISTSPNFPILAAQSADYLEAQLKAFKGHGRSDPAGFEYMWGVSSRLSEQQIAGLSRYFSEQLPAPGRSIDPVREKLGQAIYADGIGVAGVPACAACHGAKGEGMAAFPRLAGQHADYVAKQLTVLIDGISTHRRTARWCGHEGRDPCVDQGRYLEPCCVRAINRSGVVTMTGILS